MEEKWAPHDLPIFDLVPPAFENQITMFYEALGCPAVSSKSFWDVYSALLSAFHNLGENLQISESLKMADSGDEDHVPLLEGLKELRYGDGGVGDLGYIYYGGLNSPSRTEAPVDSEEEVEEDLREFADFTDDEH